VDKLPNKFKFFLRAVIPQFNLLFSCVCWSWFMLPISRKCFVERTGIDERAGWSLSMLLGAFNWENSSRMSIILSLVSACWELILSKSFFEILCCFEAGSLLLKLIAFPPSAGSSGILRIEFWPWFAATPDFSSSTDW